MPDSTAILRAAWTAIRDPLQGKISLAKVFWLYGVAGSVFVSAMGLLIGPGHESVRRPYEMFGFIFSVYVTFATYRCAGNCPSKSLARFVRISALISLAVLPVFAYLEFTGALDLAFVGMQGEQ